MRVIKRAILSLKSKKFSTMLTVIIFSVIFSLIFSGMIIYSTSEATVSVLKKSVSNAVSVSGVSVTRSVAGTMQGGTTDLCRDTALKIADSKYAEAYNLVMFDFGVFDESYKKIPKNFEDNGSYSSDFDCCVYGTVYSDYDIAFTVNGYKLISGEHFSAQNGGENICMISKEFAELNSLGLGDEIDFQRLSSNKGEAYKLKITGIFEVPSGQYIEGAGGSPKEIVMVPYDTLVAHRGDDRVINATVFLKNSSDIDKFIEEAGNKGNLEKVYYKPLDVSEPELGDDEKEMNLDELLDYYGERHSFVLKIDSDWYEMVAKPMEKVNEFAFAIVSGFSVCAIVILVLICSLNLKKRKREYGILISIGESKLAIVLQSLLEMLIPVILAAIIGIILGYTVGVPMVKNYTDSVYSVQAELDNTNNAVLSSDYNSNDSTDLGWNHSGYTDLLYRTSSRVSVVPNAEPELKLNDVLLVIILTFLLTVVSLSVQMLYILRVKPAKIMTGRE